MATRAAASFCWPSAPTGGKRIWREYRSVNSNSATCFRDASLVIIGTPERFRLETRPGTFDREAGVKAGSRVRARCDSFGRAGLELAGPARVTSLRKATTPFIFGIGLLGAALALGLPLAWAQNP